MSVSNDETMIMINNTHRGFDLHDVSQQSILHSFTEKGLPPSAGSVFTDSDRAVAYVSSGAIRLWDIRSKSILLSVPNPGESMLAILRRTVTSGDHPCPRTIQATVDCHRCKPVFNIQSLCTALVTSSNRDMSTWLMVVHQTLLHLQRAVDHGASRLRSGKAS